MFAHVPQTTTHPGRVELNDVIVLFSMHHYSRLLFKRVLSQNKRSRMSNYRGRAMFSDSRGSWKVLWLRTP